MSSTYEFEVRPFCDTIPIDEHQCLEIDYVSRRMVPGASFLGWPSLATSSGLAASVAYKPFVSKHGEL